MSGIKADKSGHHRMPVSGEPLLKKVGVMDGACGNSGSAGSWSRILLYDYIHQFARNRYDPDYPGAFYGFCDAFVLHGHLFHV